MLEVDGVVGADEPTESGDTGDGAAGMGCGLLRSQAITPVANASTSVYVRTDIEVSSSTGARGKWAADSRATNPEETSGQGSQSLRSLSNAYGQRRPG